MLTRKSGMLALVLGVAVLGGVGCESDEVVIPPPPPPAVVVNVTPDNPPPLTVGQTLQLVAVVTNATNTAVTWQSSNTAVATVSATGLVTAVAAGNTTITATSAQDANARDAVAITVGAAPPPPPPPVITLQAVNVNCAGLPNCVPGPVNPGNVQGRVDVIANVDIAAGVQVARIETLVDGTVVCTQTISGGGEADATAAAVPVPVNCNVNTAALDANGNPIFGNGPHTFTVRAVGPTGTVLAQATSSPHIFANVDQLAISATVSGATATDGAGLVWREGDLTVNVRPAIFSGGGTPGSVTVTVRQDNPATPPGDTVTIAQATISAPTNGVFTVTFTKAGNTANQNLSINEASNELIITATSVVGGQTGPAGAFGSGLRVDHRPPAITTQPTITSGTWFGTAATLTQLRGGVVAADSGVNVNTTTVQYRAVGSTDANAWVSIAAPGDIPETEVSSGSGAWDIRVRVCDALNNCTNSSTAGSIGVDRTAPEAELDDAGVQDEDVNVAGQQIIISITEDRSGLGANPVMATLTRNFPGLTAAQRCVIGTLSASNVCQAAATTSSIAVPADEGYYTLTARAVDRAGNLSGETIVVDVLIDNTNPAVGPIGMPTSITGNGSATFTTTMTDNVDLTTAVIAVNYPAGTFFAGSAQVGTAFDATLTTSASASVTVNNFIRAILTAPNTTGSVATGVTAVAIDAAGNLGTRSENFQAGVVTAPTAAEFTEVASFTLTRAHNDLCADTDGAGCPNDGVTSTTLTATATGPSGTFNNPAQRVNFYFENALGQWVLLGTATAASSTDNGVTRTYRWTFTLAATALPVADNIDLVALAVNTAGSALMSDVVNVDREN